MSNGMAILTIIGFSFVAYISGYVFGILDQKKATKKLMEDHPNMFVSEWLSLWE